MCTVSFVNSNGKIIITSNRDEQVARPAVEPSNYLVNQKKLFFPKDPKAGGTWYVVDDVSNVLVLLNGAEKKHQHHPPYKKSRGLIVLDIFSSDSAISTWQTINLDNIEPFTLVLFQDQKLYQLRWNGTEKSKQELNTNQNHIWSSSTLYSKDISEQRANWFSTFLNNKPQITFQEMFRFHRYTEPENPQHGLIINRNDTLKTLSITQTVIEQNKITVMHHDLIQEKEFSNTFIHV
jgi:uncharacterized protein with NRDE domain